MIKNILKIIKVLIIALILLQILGFYNKNMGYIEKKAMEEAENFYIEHNREK